MTDYKVVDAEKLDTELKSLADKIREKGGTSAELDFYKGDFTNAVGAIESSGGTEELEKLIDQSKVLDSTEGTVTEKVEQLIDKAEDEKIWYLLSETLTQFPTFQNQPFEKLPRINPIKVTSFSYKLSFMSNLKRIDFYINSESCTRFDNCFVRDSALEYVKGINTANATNFYDMFAQCSSLKTIEKPLDFSKVTNVSGCFYGCIALEDIRIVPETLKISTSFASSAKLTAESKDSIFNGLATVETAQTLTLPANLKILQSQVDSANAKGWTVAGGTVVSEEEYYG